MNKEDPASQYEVASDDIEAPVVDGDLDENPDDNVGKEVKPEHDLDLDSFEGDDESDADGDDE